MRFVQWSKVAVTIGLMVGCSGAGGRATTSMPPVGSSTTTPAESELPVIIVLDPVTASPWGEGALAWLDAFEMAAENGIAHLMPFFSADLVWEDRCGQSLIRGADSWFTSYTEMDLVELFPPRGTADYFVSAHGLVRHHTVSFDLPMPISLLERMTIGPDGLRHWVRSVSVDAGRWYDPSRSDFDRYEALADLYVAGWNGDAGVASVYHQDAYIADTLIGESVSGLDQIERSAESSTWPATGHMSIRESPDDGGRAIHAALSDSEGMGPEGIWLLLDVDNGSGCPDQMAVTLELDGDQIRQERRFHSIDSVRECYEPAALESGWWEGLEIPTPVYRELTDTVTYADMSIGIFNGTPELAAFVEWGLARFDDAGLGVPQVASVTFLQAHKTCYGFGGFAQRSGKGANITMCRTADDICLDDACRTWAAKDRQLLLHELAHPWLDEHTDGAVRAEFLDLVEVPRWWDQADPWEERGVEHAGHAIAYALMNDPVEIAPELDTTCDERIAGFRILTRLEPLTSCDR